MNDTVNRQILLVEKPTGKLGPEHFKMVNGKVPEPKDGEVLLVVAFELRDPKTRKLDTDSHLSDFRLTDQSGATYASSVASTDLREMAFSVPAGTKPRTARIGGLDFDVARLSVAAQKP